MSLRWLCIAMVCLSGCNQPDDSSSYQLPLWTVDSEPRIILGGNTDSESPLFRVTGAVKIAAGYFVLNAGAHELRAYDEAGALVHTSGHEGSGPGEFRSPRLAGRLPDDSLVIFDKPLSRITIICGDMRICDSWESPPSLGAVIGVVEDRALFERIHANALIEGLSHDMHSFAITQRGVADPQFTVDLRGVSRMAKRVNGPVVSMPVPFTQPAHAALISDGLVLVDGASGQIRFLTLAGGESFAMSLPSQPVDEAQFRQVIDNLIGEASSDRQPLLRTFYEAMNPPQDRSAVRELIVDRLGLIWLHVDAKDLDGSPWLISGADGQILARVQMPSGLRVEEIGEDYVLGVWRDDLDVESVRSYGLTRK